MSSFSRSIKPPSYISRSRRPSMGGRTPSGSSDVSTNSNDQPIFSGSNTPAAERSPSCYDLSTTPRAPESAHQEASSTKREHSSSRFNRANPVSIEVPQIRKFSSARACTPPAPLSRGDLPGSYFTLHDHPESRAQQHHPFHHDTRKARHQLINNASSASTAYTSCPAQSPTPKPTAMSLSHTEATVPAASYLPIGIHDTPLPMGKYYPTNYENRHRGGVRHSSSTSSVRSAYAESDAKARVQQYQRDMVTQTKMAVSGVISNNAQRPNGSSAPSSLSPFFLGTSNMHLGAAFTAPISPRLHPLGSPGPVTPMDLEDAGGDYLSKGQSTLGVDPAGASRLEQQRGRRV